MIPVPESAAVKVSAANPGIRGLAGRVGHEGGKMILHLLVLDLGQEGAGADSGAVLPRPVPSHLLRGDLVPPVSSSSAAKPAIAAT